METTKPPVYNRRQPYIARTERVEMLTKPGSLKDTRHYEIDLADSGMQFEPGDSLAVLPTNCPELVEDIISALKADGNAVVTAPDRNEKSLREALRENCAITQPDKKFLKAVAEKAGNRGEDLASLLEPDKKAELSDYLWGREVIDFLTDYPEVQFEAREFVGLLKKLQVRLYSIASSLRTFPAEVHLTVATVTYESFGRERKGVCTTFLADRIDETTPIPCFITPGKGFRLPAPDDDTSIIMVGPGTGIAPFRAFLQERMATGAVGKTWLFFGEQRKDYDFLYEIEWQTYIDDGVLHRFDTAFSRDQDHKIYVQDRMLGNAAELWKWLDEGAILYVCGDALRMAKDVDAMLHRIVREDGGKSEEQAAEYVALMKKEKRYRRDVY